MNEDRELTNLEQLLDRIAEAGREEDRVTLGGILEMVGRRSFSPMLLVAGLITVAPIIGDIPGVPTIMGIFVFLIAGQLLFHRDHFWLPQWMLRRSMERDKIEKAVGWLRRPARFIDRFLRPRLTVLTRGAGIHAIAAACLVIAVSMPAMEFIPLSANGAGAALTAFGLSLVAHDGLLALLAFIIFAATLGFSIYGFL
jgi:hypothetical protein